MMISHLSDTLIHYAKLRKELNGCTICLEAIADQMALAVCRSNTAGALMILASQLLATQCLRRQAYFEQKTDEPSDLRIQQIWKGCPYPEQQSR